MLFAYRGGKNRITPKVWLKLERAERQVAGQESATDAEPVIAEHETNPKEFGSAEVENFGYQLREDETPYRYTPKAKLSKVIEELAAPIKDVSGIELILGRIANALEKLVEIEERKKS